MLNFLLLQSNRVSVVPCDPLHEKCIWIFGLQLVALFGRFRWCSLAGVLQEGWMGFEIKIYTFPDGSLCSVPALKDVSSQLPALVAMSTACRLPRRASSYPSGTVNPGKPVLLQVALLRCFSQQQKTNDCQYLCETLRDPNCLWSSKWGWHWCQGSHGMMGSKGTQDSTSMSLKLTILLPPWLLSCSAYGHIWLELFNWYLTNYLTSLVYSFLTSKPG